MRVYLNNVYFYRRNNKLEKHVVIHYSIQSPVRAFCRPIKLLCTHMKMCMLFLPRKLKQNIIADATACHCVFSFVTSNFQSCLKGKRNVIRKLFSEH
jgi:hypothetical protein